MSDKSTAEQISDEISETIMALATGRWIAISSLETQFIAQRSMIAEYALRYAEEFHKSDTKLSLLVWAQKELMLKNWKWPEYKDRDNW